jgi:hypothetical protein
VHVHPPQMIQLSAGVPQNNNSYGLEEEHDSMWAVLAVMDIPIATAISQGVAGCNKRHCTGAAAGDGILSSDVQVTCAYRPAA